MRVLVIVPAYNEEENIACVVDALRRKGIDYVVVNDGSNDNTLKICRDNSFNYLNLPKNLGIGGAVQAGHLYAQRNGYDIDIQFDGDGQHDVSCIPNLVDAIEGGADLVVGSRFIGGSNKFKSTTARRMGINFLKHVIKMKTGLVVNDVTSGFRACNRKAIDLFCNDYPEDYPEPESIVNAKLRGLTIQEVPVIMHERQGGASSIHGFKSIYYMVKVTLAILFLK